MLIKLRKMMTNQKGFTLVELMVVIAIIGVLAAIAIPKFTAATNSARDGALKANLSTVDSALVQYFAATGAYPATTAAVAKPLLEGTYIGAWPKDTAGNDLAYTLANGAYTLTGVSTAGGAAKLSPGSTGYAAQAAW